MGKKNLLYKKIDGFIKKYYQNKLIKGLILFFSSSLILLIIFAITEYIGKLNSNIRTFMFWFYIIFNIFIIIKYVFFPILGILKLKKTISKNHAAKLIGFSFIKIQDKLLNYIELKKIENTPNDLLEASINQKIKDLEKFKFKNAINFSENKKFIKYLLIPVFFGIILFLSGNIKIITEGTKRVALYSYDKNSFSPFSFKILNTPLKCAKYDDFIIQVKITGSVLPEECRIHVDNDKFYKLKKISHNTYKFNFKNLQKDTRFKLSANGYYSNQQIIKVYSKPELINFDISINYPDYINKKNETIKNNGNLKVPLGTKLNWSFKTRYVNMIKIKFKEDSASIHHDSSYTKKIMDAEKYSLILQNSNTKIKKIKYQINIIKDQYPKITAKDTLISNQNKISFNGAISDDYGFSSLVFYYSKNDSLLFEKINIPVENKKIHEAFNIEMLVDNKKDSVVNYYFEVTDNDAINGGKSSKTSTKEIKIISNYNLTKLEEKTNHDIINKINLSKTKSTQINESLSKIKNSLINQDLSLWEQKQTIKNIRKEYSNIKKTLEEVNKNLAEKNLNKMSNEEEEKLNALKDLLKKILDEDIKKMLEEINNMLDKTKEKDIMKSLKEIEKNKKEIDKELERYEELFKNLEFDEKLQNIINNIDDLKEKQNLLNKKNDADQDFDNLEKEQKNIQEKFKEIQKELMDLKKLNDSLEAPKKIEPTSEDEENIIREMQKSLEELNKKMRQKSQKSQKKIKKELEAFSKKLQSSKSQMEMNATYENMEHLRQLLDNLIILSLNQEDLIYSSTTINQNDPLFLNIMRNQKNIIDNSKMIQDSLFSLSKRVIQIKSIINKEIEDMNFNLEESLSALEERRVNSAKEKQQYAMTSSNNLAVLLSEVLLQMQISLSKMTDGEKMCNNPNSKGKGSLSNIKGLQDGIKKRLEDILSKNKNNKGNGGQKMNKELIKLAAEQEFLRMKLSEIRNQLSGEKNAKKILQEIEEMMEKNEQDMLNNNLNNLFIMRQNKIKTRLLQAEKAIKEQDLEEKRMSEESEQQNNSKINKEITIKNINKNNIEKTNKITPYYNNFYRKKIINYLNYHE